MTEDTDIHFLVEEKKRIEEAIELELAVLNRNGIGMTEPLTDAQDFPRNDINVYEVRYARAKIIRLRNDFNAICNKILETPRLRIDVNTPEVTLTPILKPFAKILEVQPESPVGLAGLINEDEIVELGNITSDNFKDLRDVEKAVKESENSYIKVVVHRQGQRKRVNLKPKKWNGRGLLGCRVVIV